MLERIWKSYLRRSSGSLWNLLVPFLWVSSIVYRPGLALDRAIKGKQVRTRVPVISIGNISIGGTGKTPIVELLSKELSRLGLRVGIASSGYGRESKNSLHGDAAALAQLDTRITGDEVKLMATDLATARFAVDRSKASAARTLAESGQVDLVLVDDGFQHHQLYRHLDIITFDATISERNLRLFPLGVLREPMTALRRADVVIITRAGDGELLKQLKLRLSQLSPEVKQYVGRFVSQELINRSRRFSVNYLKGKRVLLFAGVGNFDALRAHVESFAGKLDCVLELGDHQRYGHALLERIKELAELRQSDILVTTGKDWVKLGEFDFGRECCYLDLTTELDPGNGSLITWICEKLQLKTETN